MMTATAQTMTPTTAGIQPLLLPVDAGYEPARIPGIRKAAVLMLALGDDVAKELFQNLSEQDVERVTNEITRLGEVPVALSTQVMTEFYGLLETQQYMLRGGPEYAMRLLTDAFGSERAEELLAQVKRVQERTTGDLAVLQEMDPQQLSKFLENEHPQTVALVLAHLAPERGSALLMSLKPKLRVDAVQRLAEMRHFSPEMAQKVALVLHRRMDAVGASGRQSYAGFKAVAELLNRLDQGTSRGILEDIEQKEPKLAISIRDLMFTFDDLLTVPQNSIREIVGAVDKKVLTTALKGAKDGIRAHIFKVMSSRAVDMLREDMDAMGPVRGKEVTQAQLDLLACARRLEAEGRITLKLEAENEFAV